MRHHALTLVLLLLGLALPALAQAPENPPVLVFYQQLSQRLDSDDVAGAITMVQKQPAEAEQLFNLAEAALDSRETDPENARTYGVLMNFLARVFQVRLQRGELAARLQGRNLLADDSAWAGTPLEGTPPKPAQGVTPAAGSVDALLEEVNQILREGPAVTVEARLEGERSNLAGRLGDTRAAFAVAEHFFGDLVPRVDGLVQRAARIQEQAKRYGLGDPRMDALLGQFAEEQKSQAELWKTSEVAQLYNLGLYTEAARRGEELLAEVTHPEVRAFLQVLLLQVGRSGGQPELVRRHLGGLQPEAPGDRFYVEAVRFEDELRREPDLAASRFLERHDRAWKALGEVPDGDYDRFVGYGVGIWALAATEVALGQEPEDPLRARIQETLDRDLAALTAKAERLWKAPVLAKEGLALNPDWNPQFLFSLLDLHLDLAARARETGDPERAARELAGVEARLPQLEAALPALEAAAAKLFAGSKMPLDVRRGTLSRIPGRAREERGRQEGRALPAFEAALKLYERAGATGARLNLLPDLARACLEAGDPARALQVADQAVAEARKSGQRVALARALAARGQIRVGLGKSGAAAKEAVADLSQGTELLEALLTELGGASAQARRLRQEAEPAYELLTRLQAEAGQGEAAFATLARGQQVRGFESTSPGDGRAAPVQALRLHLAGLEQERLALASLPDSTRVQDLKARNSELLASTRSEFYARLGQLYQEDPAYQRLAIRPVVYGQIQSNLPEDTVVLQYLPSEGQTWIFVLTREAMRVRRVDVREAELRAAVDEFRARMAAFTRSVEQGNAQAWAEDGSEAWRQQVLPLRNLLARLHGLLIAPVEEDLAGKPVVAVIPTGELMYLPFSALGRERTPGGDLEFLAERKQVATLVKASDLLGVGTGPRQAPGPVVAFGNPDGTLQAAEQEVEALKDLFPDARVFVGGQASYDRLRSVVGEVGYLHLATHGVLDGTPSMNHLVLAGLPEGRLTMREIADLQLGPSTRLVTLSGCQTAMNTGQPETELLQSVADAFGFAGSPSVLASLWRVADESTRDLMVEFYRQLKAGRSRAEALQGAEKLLLADPKRRHPFYWAPFVLLGDWR